MELAGRAAIVTGGGSGIGRATALALAAAGTAVLIVDLNPAGAGTTAAAIRAAGGRAETLVRDVTDDGALLEMFARAERFGGGLDILFNNAGVATGLPAFPAVAEQRWRQALALNLDAVIRATQLAIPLLQRRGGGAIVNTSSMAGITGLDIDPVYAAAKAGVLAFTRSLAWLRTSDHIRVSCICPGVVETPFVRAAEDPRLTALAQRYPTLPPEEIAAAVLGLLRDDEAAGCALQVSASRPRAYWVPI